MDKIKSYKDFLNENEIEIIVVESSEQLKEIIKESPSDADLNHLDVSRVTDMSWVFWDSKFNGDISNWDVSNVTNMDGMFYKSNFNGDISNWKINKNCNINNIFKDSQFTGENTDFTNWDPDIINKLKKDYPYLIITQGEKRKVRSIIRSRQFGIY